MFKKNYHTNIDLNFWNRAQESTNTMCVNTSKQKWFEMQWQGCRGKLPSMKLRERVHLNYIIKLNLKLDKMWKQLTKHKEEHSFSNFSNNRIHVTLTQLWLEALCQHQLPRSLFHQIPTITILDKQVKTHHLHLQSQRLRLKARLLIRTWSRSLMELEQDIHNKISLTWAKTTWNKKFWMKWKTDRSKPCNMRSCQPKRNRKCKWPLNKKFKWRLNK